MTAGRSQVTACIVNWNGADVLPDCLRAVLAQEPSVSEVIVVDDASTDDSVRLIEESFPAARIIRHTENRGPAAARNSGYARSRGDVVVFVDNDVQPEPGCFAALVSALEGTSASLAMPRVLYARAPHMVQYDGAGAHCSGLMSLANSDRPAAGLSYEPREIGSLITACFALDRRHWGAEPPFDEAFGMYFEDHDLGLRARQAGHRILAVPTACCRHGDGAPGVSLRATGRFTKMRVVNTIRNRWQIVLKRYQLRTIMLLVPSLALFELVQLAGVVRKGWLGHWAEAARWILVNRHGILAERHATARRRRVGDGALLEGGPVPLNPNLATTRTERTVQRALSAACTVNWRLARRVLERHAERG